LRNEPLAPAETRTTEKSNCQAGHWTQKYRIVDRERGSGTKATIMTNQSAQNGFVLARHKKEPRAVQARGVGSRYLTLGSEIGRRGVGGMGLPPKLGLIVIPYSGTLTELQQVNPNHIAHSGFLVELPIHKSQARRFGGLTGAPPSLSVLRKNQSAQHLEVAGGNKVIWWPMVAKGT